ncbi:MAG: prepilin peptidase [Halolamina sp.]
MLGAFTTVASLGDLARLLAVPLFGWAALRDVRTRRIPNWVWYVLGGIGAVLLVADLLQWYPYNSFWAKFRLTQVAISLFFVAPLAIAFHLLSGFGGADAKALVALSILFPTYPTYHPPIVLVELGVPPILPVKETLIGVFSFTILTNTVLVGALGPLALAVKNGISGKFGVVMFLGKTVDVSELPSQHGRLYFSENRSSLFELLFGWTTIFTNPGQMSLSRVKTAITPSGLDVDALRMYLRWRDLPLATLRANPEHYRDPGTVGATAAPTDGAVDDAAVEHGVAGGERTSSDGGEKELSGDDGGKPTDGEVDDPWAAERFLAEIEGSAYGTDPATLRAGLEAVAWQDEVWLSPGLPFIVPMFVGLLVALTYGDVLYGLLTALGLA